MSLIETVVSVWMGGLVVLCLLRILMSLWSGDSTLLTAMESEYAWSQIHRVLMTDIHGAVDTSVESGMLLLTEANGTEYQYTVNLRRELIRTQRGGGTSVIAVGIQSVQFQTSGGMVSVTVVFPQRPPSTMVVSALQSYLP